MNLKKLKLIWWKRSDPSTWEKTLCEKRKVRGSVVIKEGAEPVYGLKILIEIFSGLNAQHN